MILYTLLSNIVYLQSKNMTKARKWAFCYLDSIVSDKQSPFWLNCGSEPDVFVLQVGPVNTKVSDQTNKNIYTELAKKYIGYVFYEISKSYIWALQGTAWIEVLL